MEKEGALTAFFHQERQEAFSIRDKGTASSTSNAIKKQALERKAEADSPRGEEVRTMKKIRDSPEHERLE